MLCKGMAVLSIGIDDPSISYSFRSSCAQQRWKMANVRSPASIESIVSSNDTAELILKWSRSFCANELSVEDMQDRIAALNVSETNLPHRAKERVIEAQQELDAIRWGMCEAGQHAEIGRIFAELAPLFAGHQAK
jgi:hypothetical protein